MTDQTGLPSLAKLLAEPAAAPAVGPDAVACVFDADGALLWTTASGRAVAARLDRPSRARLAKLASSQGFSPLRISLRAGGVGFESQCSALRLADGTWAVLAQIAGPAPRAWARGQGYDPLAYSPASFPGQSHLAGGGPREPAPDTTIGVLRKAAGGRPTLRFVWHTGADGVIRSVSAALARALGGDGEIVGQCWSDLADRIDGANDIDAHARSRRAWSGVATIWRLGDDRTGFPVEFGGAPVRDVHGADAGQRGYGLIRLDEIAPVSEPAADRLKQTSADQKSEGLLQIAAGVAGAARAGAAGLAAGLAASLAVDQPKRAPAPPQLPLFGGRVDVAADAPGQPVMPPVQQFQPLLPGNWRDSQRAGAAQAVNASAGVDAPEVAPAALQSNLLLDKAAGRSSLSQGERQTLRDIALALGARPGKEPAGGVPEPLAAPRGLSDPALAAQSGLSVAQPGGMHAGTETLAQDAGQSSRFQDAHFQDAGLADVEATQPRFDSIAPDPKAGDHRLADAQTSLINAGLSASTPAAEAKATVLPAQWHGTPATPTDVAPGAAKMAAERAPDESPQDIDQRTGPAELSEKAARVDAIRSLVQSAPVAALVSRGDAVLHANQAFVALSRHSAITEVMQAGVGALFPGVVVANGFSGRASLAGGRGVRTPVELICFPVAWQGGDAMLTLAIRDPSAEAEARAAHLEAELAQRTVQETELRGVLDTATDGVLLLDAHGRILSVNRTAEALFGYEQNQLVGEPLTRLLAAESHEMALNYLATLRGGGVASLMNDGREIVGRVRQGGLCQLFMTLGKVGEGNGGRFCAVLRDVTSWKKTESELIESRRRAEAANAQKSDFLAKMSHEVRTPLGAMIGFAELMLEERFGPIANPRYREYVRDIHESGQYVISLVNDLLDLARIEAGKMELSFASVDLNVLLASCVTLMQPQASKSRIVLRSSLEAKLPPVVADERSMRQITLNVLGNALKFTDAGGQVIVSSTHTEAGEVVIRVRDTGIGMSETDVVEALKPFRRLAPGRKSQGTGLGLPLTAALIEANRGVLRITSQPGEGTLVEVVLPAKRVLAS